MGIADIGGTLGIMITAIIAGGAGYKFLALIINLLAGSDARTSKNWREYAEKLEARLELAEAEIDELRGMLVQRDTECADKLRDLWKHVSRLEKIIRDGGGVVPGDTPPGTPVVVAKRAAP